MSAAILQMHRRESFERSATLALGTGALAGLVHHALGWLGGPVPLVLLGTIAAVAATLRGDVIDRVLLGVFAVAVPGVIWLLGLSWGWTVALGAGAAGMLTVRAQVCELGEEGQLGTVRPGPLNYAASAVMGAVLGLGGAHVVEVLARRLVEIDTPAPILAMVSGAVVSLFVVLSALPAHLALRPDPVEARCEDLIPQLSGEFRTLAARALQLYRACGEALSRVPRTAEREALARTLSEMTRSAVELASEWTGVEHQLEERTEKELGAEIAELESSARGSRDALARRQLELAAEALREELGRVEALKLRRERILAKLKAEVALLERARVSLIGIRSGQAQLRAAELSALSRRFASLSRLQGAEARLAEEVATSAELAHQEREAQASRQRDPA